MATAAAATATTGLLSADCMPSIAQALAATMKRALLAHRAPGPIDARARAEIEPFTLPQSPKS
eukprot:scaffold32350_cov60-Phaeocystis_antarctica.AAC.1